VKGRYRILLGEDEFAVTGDAQMVLVAGVQDGELAPASHEFARRYAAWLRGTGAAGNGRSSLPVLGVCWHVRLLFQIFQLNKAGLIPQSADPSQLAQKAGMQWAFAIVMLSSLTRCDTLPSTFTNASRCSILAAIPASAAGRNQRSKPARAADSRKLLLTPSGAPISAIHIKDPFQEVISIFNDPPRKRAEIQSTLVQPRASAQEERGQSGSGKCPGLRFSRFSRLDWWLIIECGFES
jgi:hypothetical protein